ncbi:MAG: TolC family protein [Bacteroidales bacterium]
MTRQIAVFLFLLTILSASGQKKWTLEDCIRYAVQNNLNIKQTRIDVEEAEQNYRQAKWNMLPSLGASSSAGYSFGRTVVEGDLVSESYFYNDYNLSASMDLFNAFSLQNQISYNKFRKEAASNSNIDAIDNLAFKIMNSYYDVIYFEELLKISRKQKELSEIIENKTMVLVKTGLKATADLLEVKADLEKDELVCVQTENKLKSAWIELRKDLNLNPDSTIALFKDAYTIIENENIDIKSLYVSHSSWSPQIKSYENAREASRKNLSIQRAAYYPSLRTGASYGTYFYPVPGNRDFSYQLKANQNQYVGISLSVPVFRKEANNTQVKLAKLNYESAKIKLDQAKQDLLYEMMTNYNDLKASMSEYTQARKQYEADTLAFSAAEKKYDQGMINVVDFYTAKNRMASTEGQVLRSELTVEIKKRIIEFYRGNRFWEK